MASNTILTIHIYITKQQCSYNADTFGSPWYLKGIKSGFRGTLYQQTNKQTNKKPRKAKNLLQICMNIKQGRCAIYTNKVYGDKLSFLKKGHI